MKNLLKSKNRFIYIIVTFSIFTLNILCLNTNIYAGEDLPQALKRAQYLLNGTLPTDGDFSAKAVSENNYRDAIRGFLNHGNFYDVLLRYHERILGVGLPLDYLKELQRADLDGKGLKFARLKCGSNADKGKLSCNWISGESRNKVGQCPKAWLEPVAPFWRPSATVWVCPSVAEACGSNLSKCFIEYADADVAKNAELGSSEAFDSRFTIIRSLSRQAAGIATAVAIENYPYTKILAPGVTAVDSAILHLINQAHHFDVEKIHISPELQETLKNTKLPDTRYKLIFTGDAYETAGVISTFGWLRRYEKNRTRANQLYERLLCRRFTSELPRVFPQDPGNLRTTPGCSGCHATLDPLADFFTVWGEGAAVYRPAGQAQTGSFIGQTGTGLADLSKIITQDEAFATCTVQHAWEWLVGRGFFKSEEQIRSDFTQYFIKSNYSFKELVYALATHPTFTSASRGDATVTDPLEGPPLGKVPDIGKKECKPKVSYAADIAPYISNCTICHKANTNRQSLETEADWKRIGKTAVGLLASGNMPPGQSGPPASGLIFNLKESVRCWLEQNP